MGSLAAALAAGLETPAVLDPDPFIRLTAERTAQIDQGVWALACAECIATEVGSGDGDEWSSELCTKACCSKSWLDNALGATPVAKAGLAMTVLGLDNASLARAIETSRAPHDKLLAIWGGAAAEAVAVAVHRCI